ncbi:MAG TPA: hypothetical protein VMF58_04670 [Rhizomicrobium sp.]|nr:hypothetical protein [Rhizomicrobium sp.]
MRAVLIAALCVPFVTGCSGMLADQVTKEAQQKCASQGKQFVQDDVKKQDNPIYSSAEVSGHCAGPGDPGYVAPK